MIRKKINILWLALVLVSCGTSKQVVEAPPKPDWVLRSPVLPSYYVGVASAVKTYDVDAYKRKVREKALANLSADIAVNISSNSVMHQFETNAAYGEDYYSMVRSSSREYLEGYELVDSYEDASYYWEYYRLSKAKYQEIKQQRMQEASAVALDYYLKAQEKQVERESNTALMNYLKGLEAVKPFWSDQLQIEHEGQTIYLGNALYDGVAGLLNSVQVQALQETVSLKVGDKTTTEKLRFSVHTPDGEPLVGIPLAFYADEKPLLNNKMESDGKGEVFYQLSSVPVKNTNVKFEARIDLNAIATSATRDPLFRKLIRTFNTREGVVQIQVEKPVFTVETTEQIRSRAVEQTPVKKRLEALLTEREYQVVYSAGAADYRFVLSANATPKKRDDQFFKATLRGEMKVYNAAGALVYSKEIPAIEGVQTTQVKAYADAYQKLELALTKKFDLILAEILE